MIQSPNPRRGELLSVAAFAIALRAIVFLASIRLGPLSTVEYTAKGDTTSYIAVAAAMTGERTYVSLDEYDRRVFPGYPALIAIVHLIKIPLPVAALIVTWLAAGIAAAAAAKTFADARIGWALTCLIPHYLINSSLGMSEAPLLAGVCLALLLSQYNHLILSGIVFGLSALIRPMACFALAGVLFALLNERRRVTRISGLIAGAAFTFAAGFVAMQQWTGNALQGIHVYATHPGAYAGHMIVWPAYSLIAETRHASASRIVYIWLHVIVTLVAVLLASVRALRPGRVDARDAVSFPWLMLNTAMVLCIGPPWGFTHFPRFTIPAAPAMFWTLRGALPRNQKIWIGIGLICSAVGVIGVIRSP